MGNANEACDARIDASIDDAHETHEEKLYFLNDHLRDEAIKDRFYDAYHLAKRFSGYLVRIIMSHADLEDDELECAKTLATVLKHNLTKNVRFSDVWNQETAVIKVRAYRHIDPIVRCFFDKGSDEAFAPKHQWLNSMSFLKHIDTVMFDVPIKMRSIGSREVFSRGDLFDNEYWFETDVILWLRF